MPLLRGCDLCLQKQGLNQRKTDGVIKIEAFVLLCASGVLNNMSELAHSPQAGLAHQRRNHGDNPVMQARGRESVAQSAHRQVDLVACLLKMRLVGRAPLKFCDAQNAPWPQYAQAPGEKLRPLLFSHERRNQARIHQVEVAFGKVKRLERIHYEKTGVLTLLHPGLGAGIGDHTLADVDTNNLDIRIGVGGLQYPAPRTTGNIQDPLDITQIWLLRENTPHSSRK